MNNCIMRSGTRHLMAGPTIIFLIVCSNLYKESGLKNYFVPNFVYSFSMSKYYFPPIFVEVYMLESKLDSI